MTLDQRIEKDLTELYEGKEITCAKELQSVLEVSAKGLPQPGKNVSWNYFHTVRKDFM